MNECGDEPAPSEMSVDDRCGGLYSRAGQRYRDCMKNVRKIATIGGAVLILSAGAAGQSITVGGLDDAEAPATVRPPAPADPGKPSLIVPYALTLVFAAAAVGLAVLPSARTHQD